MSWHNLLSALLLQVAPAAAAEEAQEIVVTAKRGGSCEIRLADRSLTPKQLKQNAEQWAAQGDPVRLIRPKGADYRCMVKLAWKLGEYGVRFVQFEDRSNALP